MDKTNERIVRHFRVRSTDDNMPMSAVRGGRDRLAWFLGKYGFNKGAEVGVRAGVFSKTLCENNPNIELYCIDPWKSTPGKQKRHNNYLKQAKENLKPYNASLISMTSMEAVGRFKDGSLDFVYIDGNHAFDYVAPDLIFWSQKVRKGGIVALHDYYAFKWGGVMKAVDAYTHCHRIDPWYVTREIEASVFWVKP